MVLNSGKCHFMCLGQNAVNETYVYDNTEMKNSKEEKILGVIIDSKLRFNLICARYMSNFTTRTLYFIGF